MRKPITSSNAVSRRYLAYFTSGGVGKTIVPPRCLPVLETMLVRSRRKQLNSSRRK